MLFSTYAINNYWKKGIFTKDLGKTIKYQDCSKMLEKIKACKIREHLVYILKKGKCIPVTIFKDNNYYALKQYSKIPILEINGLRMHLTKEFTSPFQYAKHVIKRIGLNKNKENIEILDCCTGLGYMAIELSRYGNVTTVEKSAEVLKIAKINPYSKELFNNKNIRIINDDVFKAIDNLGNFDFMVHDPPRFNQSPELYSLDFYKKLFSHINKDGKLFHYTGYFGESRGINIKKGVGKRLSNAGFKLLYYDNKLKGWFAKK